MGRLRGRKEMTENQSALSTESLRNFSLVFPQKLTDRSSNPRVNPRDTELGENVYSEQNRKRHGTPISKHTTKPQ